MTRPSRLLGLWLLVVVLGLVGGPTAASATAAPTGDGAPGDEENAATADTVTWSVRPGDNTGADGRSWVELDLDPGDQVTEHLVVTNHGRSAVEFRLTAADGYFTETGRFTILPATEPSVDAGTWIELPASVAVEAGRSVVVPFTVTVPTNATPGDHAAGVAAGHVSGRTDEIGVESRVGFRVMTRVTGDLAPAVTGTVAPRYHGAVNPFSPGSTEITYTVTNSGNARLAVTPTVRLAGPLGLGSTTVTGELLTEMTPGETRTATVAVPSTWPLGFLTATVDLAATGVVAEDTLAIGFTSDGVRTAAVPWSQLLTLAVGAALVVGWRIDRRRRQLRLEQLLEQARAETRALLTAADS